MTSESKKAVESSPRIALQQQHEEFQTFGEGNVSREQRYLAFAERKASEVEDLPTDRKPHEVKHAAVIGAGTMGIGIAMCFADAGIRVTLVDSKQDALTRGVHFIAKNYTKTVLRGGLTQGQMDNCLKMIQPTTQIAVAKDADLVIEAVFEDMDIKKDTFRTLDALAKSDAILATNTSYLDINQIAKVTSRPSSVVGMHFFSPARVMRVVEVVRGTMTSQDIISTAIAISRQICKAPVVVGVCHGFVGNRMQRARSVQAERLLLEGALPHEIDQAMTEFGFPMGPFAAGDLAGLDISWRMRKAQGAKAPIADALCEAGRFGQKVGNGWYHYEAGSRSPIVDPEVEKLIISTSQQVGLVRHKIGKQEIVDRLLFSIINEGAKVLEEGIARRPGDVDVIWVYGFGFPAWRGGPMYYADQIGLSYIRNKLAEFSRRSCDDWLAPSKLLTRLVAEGKTFNSLSAET